MNLINNSKIYFKIEGLTKEFPGIKALDNIDLEIKEKEVLGLAGENGAGKSTLLGIIAGILKMDKGNMWIRGQKYCPENYNDANKNGVFMVFQEQGLVPSIYAFENLFLGHEKHFTKFGIINKSEMMRKSTKEIEKLGLEINLNKLTRDYSFQQRQMLEIAKAFILAKTLNINLPLILLDEPTSGLNDSEINILFKKIHDLKDKATFIFVSHRLNELVHFCDRICILKDGKKTIILNKKDCDNDTIHEYMVGRKKRNNFYAENLQIKKDTEIVFSTKKLEKNGKFKNVSFNIKGREILGIGGVIGCGKDSLGKCLIGLDKLDKGEIFIWNKKINKVNLQNMLDKGVGYVPRDRKEEGIIGYLSIKWNITLPSIKNICWKKLPLLNKKKEDQIAKEYIKKFAIKAKSINDLCCNLSGGNQQKVLISKWVAKNLRILILDNPTRGIDVGAKEEIYKIIRKLTVEGLSIILITDDLLELIGLSNKILIMKDGQITSSIDVSLKNKPKEKEIVRYMV